jgi:hypothetical protein
MALERATVQLDLLASQVVRDACTRFAEAAFQLSLRTRTLAAFHAPEVSGTIDTLEANYKGVIEVLRRDLELER